MSREPGTAPAVLVDLFGTFLYDSSVEEAVSVLRSWGPGSPAQLRRFQRALDDYLAERPHDGSALVLVEDHANVGLDECTEDAAWAFIDEFADAFRAVVRDLDAAGRLPRA